MDLAARSLHTKRQVISRLLEEGLYPYTKRYLGSFDNHFSTIGLVGMNEACLNACWIREDLSGKEAQDFTKKVLNHMRTRLSDYQEQYDGELFNLEATPAESTTYRLPSMMFSTTRTSSPQQNPAALPTIPTAPICPLAIRRISSRLSISRMSFRPFTPQVLYSIHSLVKSSPTGRVLQRWCVRSRRIIGFLTIQCLPPIRSARSMAISQANTSLVRIAAQRQRFTAA